MFTLLIQNADKPTDPSLPECNGGRRGHSLSPSHGKRTVDGEACIQLHNALHSREVKQSVDIVGTKRQLLDYDLKGWHFQASTSQHTPDASMKQHEEAMLRTTEENNRLKGQLFKMKKENERLQAEEQKLNATSMTTMREAKSEKEHMMKALQVCTCTYMYVCVLVHRWSLYTGGPCTQVVLVHRWSLCTGGPCIQVVLVYRWSLYTGGPCTQVVLVHRWSLYTGGPCIQVVLVYRWLLGDVLLYLL